jgi:hypothetical protein
MATDKRKVWLGALLLFVSSILIFVTGPFDLGLSTLVAGLAAGGAALGLAAGALLVGTSEDGRPV